ncbi:MAG: amidohydrolase family protein, partial [Oricola sp.]|nr:amidohydrolase family protein [Oricola sp.]
DDRIEDETSYIEDLAASEDFRICGAIAACRPEAPGFSAFLERSLSHSLVVGFRRPLHVVPDGLSETDQFRENIRSLARPDLPFDICVFARQLPLAIALADAAPNTRFVLDHCGVPDIAGGEWEAWAEHIRDLAKRPNISAKISGVIAYAGDNWTLSELSRWVEHVVEAFGVDRICWGGDWPVCTLGGGLSTWVAASRAITAAWSAEERDKLFIRNAEKIWNV